MVLTEFSEWIQAQALYGDYRAVHNTPIQVFWGDFYDYYFDGQASYWSDTKTVTISDTSAARNTPATSTPTSTSTPTESSFPTQTPVATSTEKSFGFDLMQTAVVVLAVVVAVLAAVIVLVFRHYRKPK